MSVKLSDDGGILEWCAQCRRDTLHSVQIEIRTESKKRENAQYSREPYRVSECAECGDATSQRMNNA